MYLPRAHISHLYLQLVRSHHALSPPVLILVALEPDALCACRILAALLKRDYVPHKIKPIAGYGDLAAAGKDLVQPMRHSDGGNGGVVVCLGVGGLVDLEAMLGLEQDEQGHGGPDGVDVWVLDSRRPWNLSNVFGEPPVPREAADEQIVRKETGLQQGQLSRAFKSSRGGIVVFDDGDIQEELSAEREAWFALDEMPDVSDDGHESDASESEDEITSSQQSAGRKRKSWDDEDELDSEVDKENSRPRQRRRSNSVSVLDSHGSYHPLTYQSSPIPSDSSSPLRRPRSPPITSTPPSNQLSSQPELPRTAPQPSARKLRRRLLRLRRKHEATIRAYHSAGTSYAEPISSLMYSLASELGREDNDLLWLAIIGVSSTDLYGRTSTGFSLTNHDRPVASTGWSGSRGSRIRQVLRDEVRRLNPPDLTETGREIARGAATDAIPIHARSSTDTAIRLSPEPRFLLIRHWSLYDSMLHSPYLSAKLHVWSDAGRRRLHKLLAKMGVSLTQCKQSYTHMDMDLKRVLRERLIHVAPMYGLDALIPPASTGRAIDQDGWGFVRSWGWKACLSATDVAVIIGAILEVDQHHLNSLPHSKLAPSGESQTDSTLASEDALKRFYTAYDALLSPSRLTTSIPVAQSLHRAILRTGTSILQKRQIRHLRAFRMALIKEGPDMGLFCASGALTKLALWLGEAVAEVEPEKRQSEGKGRAPVGTPLVLGCLDEAREVYVLVGMGGGGGPRSADLDERKNRKEARAKKAKDRAERREKKQQEREARRADRENEADDDELETEDEESEASSSDSDDSDDDDVAVKRGVKRNRFGNAFQEVVEETNARVRLDSFEHSVVEVRKEDLSGFLESLSMKAVVG